MEDVSKSEARKARSPIKGRGAASYVPGRYAVTVAQGLDADPRAPAHHGRTVDFTRQ